MTTTSSIRTRATFHFATVAIEPAGSPPRRRRHSLGGTPPLRRVLLVLSLSMLVAACGASTNDSSVDTSRIEPFSPASGSSSPGAGASGAPGEAEDPEAASSADERAPEGASELPLDAPSRPIDGEVAGDVDEGALAEDGLADDAEITEPTGSPPAEPTGNLFTDLLGIPEAEVQAKLELAVNRIFGIGTGESATPVQNQGYRIYYELPQDQSLAFIWAPDSQDIRSEGMSYGMMIAVQMDMQQQFDRLWRFARTFLQYPGNSGVTSWRYYFRWVGRVDTQNANNWNVSYGTNTGPAPDGEEYFAAALYLADLRWGSQGAFDYRRDADDLTSAMLNNPRAQNRTPVFHPEQDIVVFYPNGGTANFSDPSYHLPAFYDLFALEGPAGDSARWRRIAEGSRDFLVRSAHPQTGLHPDYANFDGSPNRSGSSNHRFQFDAWRVPMNLGVDHAWFTQDERVQRQATKYHEFFITRLRGNDVVNQLYDLDGGNASDGGSTALTASLAAAALASTFPDRARFVQNLWNIGQQSGFYRYYQETVYVLGLLATSGRLRHEFPDAP